MASKRNIWHAPNLNEVLASLGYTHEPAEFGARRIIQDGAVQFSGTAGEVWAWLREEGEIRSTCRECSRSHEEVELDLSGCCEDCDASEKRVARREQLEDIECSRGDYLREQMRDGAL